MREIRLFVSSPDDAQLERKRLAQVVERLNGEVRGVATIRPVRWETSFYKAHTTFQKQIPEAADCDIVVGILRHRLGTPLPNDFPTLPSGEPYPSGTAYEVLSALERRRTSELPDVYVFRFTEPPTVRLDDAAGRKLVEEQWERVKKFFASWFLTADGQFKAAFQTFASTDDFEQKVEALLRQWIREHILHGRSVVWPVEFQGSPFRGLEAFDAKHAPVFFGRSRDIGRAAGAIQEAAERGAPYLLVIGPSGAGKSSMARAGLLPRITSPGVVPEVDVWRIVKMRPGERSGDPFIALAELLLQTGKMQDAYGTDGAPALPEIAQSGFTTPRDLADLLFHADATAIRPVLHALDAVAEAERAAGGYERPVAAALLLLVDQLDELLSPDVPEDVRRRFAALLLGLCRTRRVWIVATLRADLYERYIAVPDLLTLKTEGASYDLQPPGPAELAEIVRLPAKAADLVYEADAAGRTLDERLLADAERADILPLVQFTLNRLFEQRVNVGGEVRLTHAAYDAIGGLGGAIDHEAERALAPLGEAEVSALPRLLRELAAPARGGSRGQELSIRAVPLERVAHDGHSRRLVDALVEARILLASGDEKERTVRITHERVLTSWKRAREIVAEHGDFFRIREEVEDERQRWEATGRRRDRLIPPGLRLAEAESIQKRFKEEIPTDTNAFIAASGNRARLRQRLTTGAAVVFFGVAIAAGYFAWLSRQNALAEQVARNEAQQRAAAEQVARESAERNFEIARQTVDGMVADVASGLRGSAGVPLEAVQSVLSNVEAAVDRLSDAAGTDGGGLERTRLAMLIEFGDTYQSAGDSVAALRAYDDALALSRALGEPGLDTARILQRSGILKHRIGWSAEGLVQLEEALALGRALVADRPDDIDLWKHISRCLNDIGDIKKRSGHSAEALAAFLEGVAISRQLLAAQPDNVVWKQELAASLLHAADMQAVADDVEAALVAYEEALSLWRAVAETDPGNMGWLQDVTVGLVSLADVQLGAGFEEQAVAAYEEALAIRRRLTHSDPGNMGWRRDLGEALERVGVAYLDSGKTSEAIGLLSEALEFRRHLTAYDPENLEWQRDLAITHIRLGDAYMKGGADIAVAAAAYEDGLDILRNLTSRESRNTRWLRNLAGALVKAGGVLQTTGDAEGALDLFEEALSIRRRLVELDPENTYWRIELVENLERIAGQTEGSYRAAAVSEALDILEGLARDGNGSGTDEERAARLRAMIQ